MKSLGRYFVICTVAVVLAGVASIFISMLLPSTYKAETTLVVGEKTDVVSAQFGDQAQAITNTISQLIRSSVVAQTVINQLKLSVSPEDFLKKLDVKQKPDAAVLTVSYSAKSKAQAVAVLTAVNTAYTQQFKKVGADIPPPKATSSGDIPERLQVKARVFDAPHALTKKASPRPVRNLAVAMLLGLMIAIFWIAFSESSRKSAAASPSKGGTKNKDGNDESTSQ